MSLSSFALSRFALLEGGFVRREVRCEPAFVADTAEFLARLRGENVEDLQAYTADNFHRLFSKTKARAGA